MSFTFKPRLTRILAIYPFTQGLGFALFEIEDGQAELIDWGVKSAESQRDQACLRICQSLFELMKPAVLAVEDASDMQTARRRSVEPLLHHLAHLAASRKIKTARISKAKVRRIFMANNSMTKYDLALELGRQYPELLPSLPPKRRCGMCEDRRMNIFAAVALALTILKQHQQ